MDVNTVVKRELTKDELHKLKYQKMFNDVDNLKDIRKTIENYRMVIGAANKRKTVPKIYLLRPSRKEGTVMDYNQVRSN